MVTDAIVAARGKELDNSDPSKQYSVEKLIGWMQNNLPSLNQFEHLKAAQKKERDYLKKIEAYRDELMQQGLKNHEII